MVKKYKNVAIIMSALDSDMPINVCRGIRERAKDLGIATFVSAIAPSEVADSSYNRGEYGAFRRIDYSQVDGIIVALNTIQSEQARQLVEKQLSTLAKPIVAIDCEIPGAYSLISANFSGMRKLVEHMIVDHGYRKINFISGPDDNQESKDRTEAYCVGLQDHGIPFEEGRFYKGCFYVPDGAKSIEYFEANGTLEDCDAIVCANDVGALALMSELKKRGYRVPEDIAVTGFDNVIDGGYDSVGLTTIRKPEYEMGMQAIDMMSRILSGGHVEEMNQIDAKVIIRESCGCCGTTHMKHHNQETKQSRMQQHEADRGWPDLIANRVEYREARNIGIGNSFYFDYYADCEMFRALGKYNIVSLMACETFFDYVSTLKTFVNSIKPEKFFVCLYTRYIKDLKVNLREYGIEAGEVESDNDIFAPFVYEKGEFHPGFVSKEWNLLQQISHTGVSQYTYSSVHFTNTDFGFVVFAGSEYPFMKHAYWNWISGLGSTLNNIYYNLQLKDAIRKLNDLYITDPLTRLYNRFGMTHYWEQYTKECRENNLPMLVLFLDLNGLKRINDIYGHEAGDFCIFSISDAIRNANIPDSAAIRYGGDEFVILVKGATAAQAEEYVESLRANIDELDQASSREYTISASIGYYAIEKVEDQELENCIEMADRQMYMNKKYKKQL